MLPVHNSEPMRCGALCIFMCSVIGCTASRESNIADARAKIDKMDIHYPALGVKNMDVFHKEVDRQRNGPGRYDIDQVMYIMTMSQIFSVYAAETEEAKKCVILGKIASRFEAEQAIGMHYESFASLLGPPDSIITIPKEEGGGTAVMYSAGQKVSDSRFEVYLTVDEEGAISFCRTSP